MRRLVLLLAVVGMHLLALLWLASLRLASRTAGPTADGMITISFTQPGGATTVPKQKPARTRAVAPMPVAVAATPASSVVDPAPPTAMEAGVGAGSMIGGCALAHDVGRAIAQDPLAMAELDALPAGILSSADAVMLWNGQWLTTGSQPAGPAGGAMRRAIEQVVSAAASDCREAPISGPQFVHVAEAGRTVMIVIGSGSWRWADLLRMEPACIGPETVDCATSRSDMLDPNLH